MGLNGLTREQIEIYADPGRSSVSLIYDLKGNVIGNSQALAIALLKLEKAMDQFSEDIDKACGRMAEGLSL